MLDFLQAVVLPKPAIRLLTSCSAQGVALFDAQLIHSKLFCSRAALRKETTSSSFLSRLENILNIALTI